MPDDATFPGVFDRLADIFTPFRGALIAKVDEPGHLYLETPSSPRYPDGFYFGMVKTGKRYVSYHLMPVYTHPDLLEQMSPELRKRMQGKSCFNFTRIDEALCAELERLTAAGFARYEGEGIASPRSRAMPHKRLAEG
jgi:hypothetical protein